MGVLPTAERMKRKRHNPRRREVHLIAERRMLLRKIAKAPESTEGWEKRLIEVNAELRETAGV